MIDACGRSSVRPRSKLAALQPGRESRRVRPRFGFGWHRRRHRNPRRFKSKRGRRSQTARRSCGQRGQRNKTLLRSACSCPTRPISGMNDEYAPGFQLRFEREVKSLSYSTYARRGSAAQEMWKSCPTVRGRAARSRRLSPHREGARRWSTRARSASRRRLKCPPRFLVRPEPRCIERESAGGETQMTSATIAPGVTHFQLGCSTSGPR